MNTLKHSEKNLDLVPSPIPFPEGPLRFHNLCFIRSFRRILQRRSFSSLVHSINPIIDERRFTLVLLLLVDWIPKALGFFHRSSTAARIKNYFNNESLPISSLAQSEICIIKFMNYTPIIAPIWREYLHVIFCSAPVRAHNSPKCSPYAHGRARVLRIAGESHFTD